MCRNRYIIRALERALATKTEWSSRFVDELAAARADVEGGRALEELRAAIAAGRIGRTLVCSKALGNGRSARNCYGSAPFIYVES